MKTDKPKPPNPQDLAYGFYRSFGHTDWNGERVPALVCWHDDYYTWKTGVYRLLPEAELKARFIDHLSSIGLLATPDLYATFKFHLDALTFTFKERVPNTSLSCTDQQQVMIPIDAVSLKNGILFLNPDGTSHFQSHDPSFFTLNQLPYPYSAEAICPRWDQFIDEVTLHDTEVQLLLQQWAGYLLTPGQKYQCMLLCLGDAATGKSTFENVMIEMLGRANCSGVPIRNFTAHYSLATSYGKMLNVAGDAEEELTPQTEGIIKEWTGGDMMQYERKWQHPFDAPATAKLMCSANSFPTFLDKSDGTWRRLKIAPFVREHPEIRDPTLPDTLRHELPGILNWSLRGLSSLISSTGFVSPASSQEIWSGMKTEANPAGMFFDDHYRYDPIAEGIVTSTIYTQYVEWCTDNGYRKLSNANFGREVRRFFPKVKRKRQRTKTSKTGFTSIYMGLVPL